MRIALSAVILALLAPAVADARMPLTKSTAHHEALRMANLWVPMVDVNYYVKPHMVRAGLCHRVSPRTVTCRFHAYLQDGRKIGGAMRVHRQRDGLLGVLLPFDPARYWD